MKWFWLCLCGIALLFLLIRGDKPSKESIETEVAKQAEPPAKEHPVKQRIHEPIIKIISEEKDTTASDNLNELKYNLAYTTEAGDLFQYNFDVTQNLTWNASQLLQLNQKKQLNHQNINQESELNLKAKGVLLLKFYPDKSKHAWKVGAKIDSISYTKSDQSKINQNAFYEPFTFNFNNKGYVSNFNFVNFLPDTAKSFLKQLILQMQTALPKEKKNAWRTRELDNLGQYRASYKLDINSKRPSILINKKKKEYLLRQSTEDKYDPFQQSQIKINEYKQTIKIAQDFHWIQSTQANERLQFETENHVWASGETRHLVHKEIFSSSYTFPKNFQSFLKLMNTEAYLLSRYYETDPTLNSLAKNLNPEQSVEMFMNLLLKDGNLANKFVINYLRLYPEKSHEFVQMLENFRKGALGGQFTNEHSRRLWYLLVQAGHKESQLAVMDAAENTSYRSYTRTQAIANMHIYEYPQEFLVQRLISLNDSIVNPTEVLDQEMKTMSLYALGSLGGESSLNKELSESIAHELGQYMENREDPRDKLTALEAMGNHGGKALITYLEPMLKNEDPELRAASFRAFRNMKETKAQSVLMNHFNTEIDENVKAVAAATLAKTPATEETMEFSNTEIKTSTNMGTVVSLIDYLGQNLESFPENKETLNEVKKRQLPARIIRELYKYVSD